MLLFEREIKEDQLIMSKGKDFKRLTLSFPQSSEFRHQFVPFLLEFMVEMCM